MHINMSLLENPPILRKDSTDRELTEGKIILITIMSLANVFMFLGNLLSIVTICSCHLRRKVSYWFVLNLAVIDFLISVTVVPLNSAWEYYGVWPLSNTACEFFTFADLSFSTISAYSIVLVSIDKYLYICYSIHYYHRMTRRLAIILIIAVWISVFIFTTISVLTEVGTREDFKDHFIALNNGTRSCIFVMTDAFVIPSAILCFFVPFFILCFTSSRIVCIAKGHIKKLHAAASNGPESDTSDLSKTVKQRGKKDINSNSENTANTDDKHHEPITQNSETKPIPSLSMKVQDGILASDVTGTCELTRFQLLEQTVSDEITVQYVPISTLSSMDSHSHVEIQTPCEQIASSDTTERPRSSSCNSYLTEKGTETKLKQTDSFRSIAKKQSPYCKLFGTVTIVIACFVFMFAPYYITTMIDVLCHCVQPWVYEDVLSVLYYMHSLVNPFIYMATDRKYKAALRSLRRRVLLKCSHLFSTY